MSVLSFGYHDIYTVLILHLCRKTSRTHFEYVITLSRMAESSHPQQMKKKNGSDSQPCALTVSKVDFIISTYPDLQPFLEMAVVLLEGVYEHVKSAATPTESQ